MKTFHFYERGESLKDFPKMLCGRVIDRDKGQNWENPNCKTCVRVFKVRSKKNDVPKLGQEVTYARGTMLCVIIHVYKGDKYVDLVSIDKRHKLFDGRHLIIHRAPVESLEDVKK